KYNEDRGDYSYIMETKESAKRQINQGEERRTAVQRQCLEKEERFQNIAGLSTMKTGEIIHILWKRKKEQRSK
ncbi:hypothetical protein OFC05_30375, partial [Escherichia coli]|nr:hypothetical protein [Escherichia coli]